jgi:hypothetical protein
MEPRHEQIAQIALAAGARYGLALAGGYKVSVIMSAETFTRLTLASPEGGTEEKVELAVDWRAHDRSSACRRACPAFR